MRRLLFSLTLAAAAFAATTLAPEARAQTPLGVFAEVDRLTGLAALDDGRVLVGIGGFEGVRVYDSNGNDVAPFITGRFVSQPLVQLADGRVLLEAGNELVIAEEDGSSWEVFDSGLNDPVAAVQLADGRVLVVENGTTGSGRVSAYAPDGTRLGTFARDSDQPVAITQLSDGRVLIDHNSFDFEIFAYAPDGTRLPAFASRNTAVDALLQLPDGRVLASGLRRTESGSDDIGMFLPSGEYLGAFAPAGAGGNGALAYLPDGRVLAADPQADAVYAYSVVPVASEPESPEASGVGAVFPQPLARGAEASVEVTPEAPGVVTIRVFDALGRLVAEARPLAGAGRQRLSVPVSGLGAGVYVVRVEGAGLAASRRVVVAE